MASCLTLFVPSWNRIAVILDGIVMVMASCRTVSVLGKKIKTSDRNTLFMASCLTLVVLSWNRIAVIQDSVVMVMAICLTVSVLR